MGVRPMVRGSRSLRLPTVFLAACSAPGGAPSPPPPPEPAACEVFADRACTPSSPCWDSAFRVFFAGVPECRAWARRGCERLTALPSLGFSAEDLRSTATESWLCGEGVPEGTLSGGAACVADLQCRSRRCRGGTCREALGLGETCQALSDAVPCGSHRGRELFCDATSHTCRAKAPPGAACSYSFECERWDQCLDHRCVRGGRAGEPCLHGSCAPGSACIEGTCEGVRVVQTIGETCDLQNRCAAGLVCEAAAPTWGPARCVEASRPCGPCRVAGKERIFLPPSHSCPALYTCRAPGGGRPGICEPIPGPLAIFQEPCPAER